MSGNEVGGGAIPAPPGVTPNLIDPPNHTRSNIALHTACLILVTIILSMLLYTRAFITRKIGADDYMSLLAWISQSNRLDTLCSNSNLVFYQTMIVSFSGLLLAASSYGIGRHIWDVPATWLIPGLKLLFVSEIMYIPIALSIKLAILLFFDRIFAVSTKMKWLTRGAMIANSIFYIVTWFKSIFLCRPAERSYNPTVPGHCGSEEVLPYVTGIWGFLSDIYLLILPIYCVWNLNVKAQRKWKLTVTFSLGLFACIASIVRFAYTVELVNNYDVTWNFSKLSLWSVLEINIGSICACLPALPAFFDRYFPNGLTLRSYLMRFSSYFSSSRSSPSNTHSSSLPAHKDTAHSDGKVAEDSYTSLGEGADSGYVESSDRVPLSKNVRGDLRPLGEDYVAQVPTRGEDIETWVPKNEPGFSNNLDVERAMPMHDWNG